MEKVYVMDNRGHETEAFKIRYFRYEGLDYFIYTLGEIDKDEYVKLYLKKLSNGEEQFISEDDWVEIKGIIQKVVKEIKNNTIHSFQDLNMSDLNEIMENDTRVFKLKKSIVEEIIYEEPRVEIKDEEDEVISLTEEEPRPTLREKHEEQFIEKIEDSIKNTFKDDTVKPEPATPKMKPIVVGSIENHEYREKYEALQREMEDYKVIIYKLKEENTILKKKLIEYRGKLEKLKDMLEDI